MAGKKNRPWKMGEPSRSWNILFSIKDIEAAELLSENLGITAAAVVRAATPTRVCCRNMITG